MSVNNIIAEIVKRDLDRMIKEKKMQGWQRERIIKTYKRKVIAHPEGAVVHDGDCSIYNDRLGVCTCGLHHCLIASGKDIIDELYPKFYDEEDNQGLIALMLEHFENDDLYYHKPVGEHDSFALIERPKPLKMTMDEILETIKNAKGKKTDG